MSESDIPLPYVPPAVPYAPVAAGPSYLGPKTIGQILDRTYRLLRSYFWLLVGIAAVPSALILAAVAAMEATLWIPMIRQWPKPPSPDAILHSFTPAVFIPVIVFFTLLSLAVFSIYLAAASYASTQADSGVRVTISEAYGLAWRRGWRHLWLLVLCYLYACLPLLLIEGVMVLGASWFVHGGTTATPVMFLLIPLVFLLYIAAIVYGILMGLRLSLAFPACVEEDLTAHAAIKRSFQLTLGAKGRIFLVILVVYAILYAGIFVVEIVAMMLAVIGFFVAMVAHIHLSALWSYIGLGFLGICGFAAMILFISLTYAGMTTALAVLYHDQRLRKDGPPPAPLQAGAAV
jgi:hypothetical protein